MSAFSNTPPQAVLPLGAYDLEELRKAAERADQRLLQADLSASRTRPEVLAEIGRAFALPAHFGGNLDALYDCITDLKPMPQAEQPGFVIILANLPGPAGLPAEERDVLLDVFRDAADDYFDRDIAFRVFYSVRPVA